MSMKKFHHIESFLSLIFLCFFLAAGYAYGSQQSSVVVPQAASSSVPVLPVSNSDKVPVKSPDKSADAIKDEYKDEDDLDYANDKIKDEKVEIADPLEPVNRVTHQFNDKLYFWALKPVAQGYKAVVPEPARIGVKNFFSNLGFPSRFLSCLLQADFNGAGTEAGRFTINTVWGIGGFLDPSSGKELDLQNQDTDLGQTLGVYGVGQGFYIVWPILGPSSPRDTISIAGDYFLSPAGFFQQAEGKVAALDHVLGNFEVADAGLTAHYERGHHVGKDDHVADGHHWLLPRLVLIAGGGHRALISIGRAKAALAARLGT